MNRLKKLRENIDEVDEKLINLFLERMKYVDEIIKVKKENDLPILDNKREVEIIKKYVEKENDKKLKLIIEQFFHEIMHLSKKYQINEIDKEIIHKSLNSIGYLGEKGSYSHLASKKYFEKGNLVSFDTFEKIFEAVDDKEIKYGVLPIENTSTGSIILVYDLLKKYNLNIIAETNIEINHNLLVKKGTKIEDIKTVYSHPQALDQSSEFLKKFNWELINADSTSKSAYMVSDSERNDIAAIASFEAAGIYNLNILEKNINHNRKNITRFIIISKNNCYKKEANKITIGFSVYHKPGALYNVLEIFDKNNINMYKLESRPIIESPFEYYFYVDLEGNLEEFKVRNIINEIKNNSTSFKVYGNYSKS